MIRTIFAHTFLVGAAALLLCCLLSIALQYVQTQDETFESLRQQALYAREGLELVGAEYLEGLPGTQQATWVAADGSVLFDTELGNVAPNQGDCPEVRSALAGGEGRAVRSANGETTIYQAVLCADGTVLRLGAPFGALRYAVLTTTPLLWVLVLVALIAGGLSLRAARQIVKPINDMDIDDPESCAYPELVPLFERIRDQKQTIQREVEDRERLRREFSANVSHELKTPLTSISGFAELMAEGMVSEGEMRSFSKDVYRESQRLIALVDDIMKLSRLDEDAPVPQPEEVDLFELAAGVVDMLAPVAKNQQVEIRLTGGPAVVTGVFQLIDEMVYNLCDNAIKYNRPGGGVVVDVSQSDDEAIVTVRDTGIGIPRDQLSRVFERFYRVDKSRSKEIGGTGLGLPIVKHGAQFHDARLELESEVGVGTTVTLAFPRTT